MLRRYGDAIEADLHAFYRLDLLDLWRDRLSPRKLLNLIDRLPRWSQFRTAYADDDEMADAWAKANDGERPVPSVPLTHWTPEVERLTDIVDILAEQTAVLVAANFEGGYHTPPRSTRPETAFERALRRAQNDAYEDLLADIEAAKRPEETKQGR